MNENKRIPWAVWKVDDNEYKLKLTTSAIINLEEKFKTNLINIFNDSIPPLKIMLTVTHAAMQKFNHGIKYKEVEELFEKYIDEGGSQTAFMTDVFMPIYQASGFFSGSMAEEMNDKLSEAQEKLA